MKLFKDVAKVGCTYKKIHENFYIYVKKVSDKHITGHCYSIDNNEKRTFRQTGVSGEEDFSQWKKVIAVTTKEELKRVNDLLSNPKFLIEIFPSDEEVCLIIDSLCCLWLQTVELPFVAHTLNTWLISEIENYKRIARNREIENECAALGSLDEKTFNIINS